MWKGDPIRLVGVRVTDFTDQTYEQISLFEKAGNLEKREKMQEVMDKINEKYGSYAIMNASLYEKKKK